MAKVKLPDVAVDLGTATTRVAVRGGVVCTVPSVIAMRGREVVATGDAAVRMEGRTPAGVEVVRPVRGGAVTDFHAAERLLANALKQAKIRRPRVLLSLGGESSEVERRAALQSVRAAGARDVSVIDRSVAAAVGAGLQVTEPRGSMLVDLGAGGTRAAILSLGGPVVQRAAPVGGDALNEAIRTWLRQERSMVVEERTAENLKQHLVDLTGRSTRQIRIRGRDLSRERPIEESVGSPELTAAIETPIQRMREVVRDVLRRASPQLSSDLLESGMVLGGGACHLEGLVALFRQDSGLPVVACEDPEMAVVRGCLAALEDVDRYTQLVQQ